MGLGRPVARCRSCRLAAPICCSAWTTCSPRPRDSIGLTLYWRIREPPGRRFTLRKPSRQALISRPGGPDRVRHPPDRTRPSTRRRTMARSALRGDVHEGDLLWAPDPDRAAQTNVAAFTRWLERTRGLHFAGYRELWTWSVTDLEGFWQAIWDYFGILASAPAAARPGTAGDARRALVPRRPAELRRERAGPGGGGRHGPAVRRGADPADRAEQGRTGRPRPGARHPAAQAGREARRSRLRARC